MMKFPMSLLAAFAVVLFQVATSMTIDDAAREESDETARIILGGNAKAGQFPWAAALFKDGRFICTSSIISENTVLTAAHCVVVDGRAENASRFHAIANVKMSSPSVRIDFASITPHPEYSESGILNDIAVFKTTKPIPFSDEVQPVCIARRDTDMMKYPNATAMGWGDTFIFSRIYNRIPDNMRYISLRVISNEDCGRYYGSVQNYTVCAQRLVGGICNGDSGGPLVHLSADKVPVQIGIASFGLALACGTVFPDAWTRTSSFYDFIREVAGNDPICEI